MPNRGTKNLGIKELILRRGDQKGGGFSLAVHRKLSGVLRVGEGDGYFRQTPSWIPSLDAIMAHLAHGLFDWFDAPYGT